MSEGDKETVEHGSGVKTEIQDDRLVTHVPRRGVLKSIAVGSLVGLAGCDGTNAPETGDDTTTSDDGGDTTSTTVSQGTPMDPAFTDGAATSMSEPNFAPFSATGSNIIPKIVMYSPKLKYVPGNNEWATDTISDYNITESAAEFTINTDYTWHNGKSVTADDFRVGFGISKYLGHSAWDYVESQSAPDDSTWRLTLSEQVNPNILLFSLFSGYSTLDTPRFEYSDILKELKNADEGGETPNTEQDGVLGQVLNERQAEPMGTGPFQFDGIDGQKLTAVPFDDHPNRDAINFDKWEFRYHSESQQTIAEMRNGRLDGNYVFNDVESMQEVQQVSDSEWDYITQEVPKGIALTFQFDHDIWGNRHARKGIAYLMNTASAVNTVAPGNKPVKKNTALIAPANYSLIEDITLENYGYDESKPEKAREQFEKAGFTKEGGTWQTEDGEPIEVQTMVGAKYTPWIKLLQVVHNDWKDFGLNVNLKTVDGSSYWDLIGKGDFETTMDAWNGPGLASPYLAFNHSLYSERTTSRWNYPDVVEVPEVGDVGGENAIEVNLDERMTQLARTLDEQKRKEIVQELVWVANQTVPKVGFEIRTMGVPITRDEWKMPSSDDPIWSTWRPLEYLPHKGLIQAKTE